MHVNRRGRRFGVSVLLAGVLGLGACGQRAPEVGTDHLPDVIYEPTPQEDVEFMLELAQVTRADIVYDLGCGDGRFLVTAAKKYGCKAVGVDNDPPMVAGALLNVKKAGLEGLVTIRQQNLFRVDLRPATVVTLYLLPHLNVKLIPQLEQLEQLKPGSRIVSYLFDMKGIKPAQVVELPPRDHAKRAVYLWVTPLEKEGS